jgi:hypothetical protein
MHEPGPEMNSVYHDYAALLLRRHRMLLAGEDADPEIRDIERRLLDLWPGLDDEQRRSLTGAAADLNWVRREGRPPPGAKTAAQVTNQDRQRLVEAEATKDWHAVLHSLRACAAVIGVADLAGCRATAYALVGLPGFAAVFRRFAESVGGR